MITFSNTQDGCIFHNNGQTIAFGVYEDSGFHLVHHDNMVTFANAMQAFSHLRSVYDPLPPVSQLTIDLFTKPARAVDNMAKFKYNEILKDMPKEVFHATVRS